MRIQSTLVAALGLAAACVPSALAQQPTPGDRENGPWLSDRLVQLRALLRSEFALMGRAQGQEMARFSCTASKQLEAAPMGLLHCPLCLGLAVVSAARFSAHAVMLLQLELLRTDDSEHPADLLGTILEL